MYSFRLVVGTPIDFHANAFYVWCAYQTLTQGKFGLFCRRRRVKSTHYFYFLPTSRPSASLPSMSQHVLCRSRCLTRFVLEWLFQMPCDPSLAIVSLTSMLAGQPAGQPAIVTLTFVAPMLPADSTVVLAGMSLKHQKAACTCTTALSTGQRQFIVLGVQSEKVRDLTTT